MLLSRRRRFRPQLESLEKRELLTTFVVKNTNDSGADSLRQAILAANADTTAGVDTINFNIAASGVQTISLAAASGPLPNITRSVQVDATTEGGFSGTPIVVLDGSNLAFGDGLTIDASQCLIKGLVINGFASGAGIVIGTFASSGVTGNAVQNCYIGTDATGNTGVPNGNGILLDNGATGNTIGTLGLGIGNVISGNSSYGVEINGAGTTNNSIVGNMIGTDPTGKTAVPNLFAGLTLAGGAQNNTVGGAFGGRNIISGNIDYGILVQGVGTNNNTILGNFIGPDATGGAFVTFNNGKPDVGGVVIVGGAQNNTIGGTLSSAGNLISANGSAGVEISDATTSGNVVEGNLIGTTFDGLSPLANNGDGVFIIGAPNNTIGGSAAGARNILSGNARHGVTIFQATASGNVVQNNFIGSDINGTINIANGDDGIRIDGAPSNVVRGNVLSGNSGATQNGLSIVNAGANGNRVVGNFIGVDPSGLLALPNAAAGVAIGGGAQNNTIGGTTSADANEIVENRDHGVVIQDAGTSGNVVEGNFIGVNILPAASGIHNLANVGDGVFIDTASNNTIGGTVSGAGNTIAFNTGAGVFVNNATGNSIFENSITENSAIIDGPAGTLNVIPTLTSAVSTTNTIVSGSLVFPSANTYRLEFFSNPSSGFGSDFIGSAMVTGGPGNVPFVATLPIVVNNTRFITATATGQDNTTNRYATPFVAVQTPGIFTFSAPAYAAQASTGSVTITVNRTGGSDGSVGVHYSTTDSSAVAGTDYTTAAGDLTFGPGDATPKTFTVKINPNASGNRSFLVSLTTPTGGAVVGLPGSAVVNIIAPLPQGNAQTVNQIFLVVLGRPADTTGLKFWTDQLAQGVSVEQVVLGIEGSMESLTHQVQTLFQSFLRRAADSQGIQDWTAFLIAGGTIEQVKAGILGSPEYFKTQGGGTLLGFLKALYHDALGRDLDASGQFTYGQFLVQGDTPYQVALVVVYSPEALVTLVNGFYKAILHRNGDAPGINNWVNAMLNGIRDEEVVALFFASPEFTGGV